jgi:hypothetical protein
MFRKKNKFFQDLDYLVAQDLNDNKITYDKLVRVSPYFEKDPALSYSILLKQREDLDQETKTTLESLVIKKKEDENKKIQHLLEVMEPKDYSLGN